MPSANRARSVSRMLALATLVAAAGGCGSSPPAGGSGGSGAIGGSGGSGAIGGSGGRGGATPSTPAGGTGGAGGGGPAAAPDAAGGAPGTDASAAAAGPLTTYQTCSDQTRVGKIGLVLETTLDPPFTGIVDGYVYDSVNPMQISQVVEEVGGCRIRRPPRATPPCASDCVSPQECIDSVCRLPPSAQDVGTLTVDGLKAPGRLMKNDRNIYSNPTWPHPGFDEGDEIVLRASGAGSYPAFSARGRGVAPLVVPGDKLRVENGKPVTLTWTPPGKPGPTRLLLNFSVNRHGAVDTWLECEVPDTGSYTIDAAIVSRLFTFGISGFPSVDMRRQTADTATVPAGCLEFNVSSPVNREIDIPGLISCGGDPEPGQPPPCPAGQTCGDDFRCR